MGENTGISWTDHTWNSWVGCRKKSQGCKHCYMFRDQERYGNDPTVVRRTSPATFNAPLKWEPGKVFTCSWSDFFIKEADPWRADAWDIIRRTPQHTYQILTKRPENVAGRVPCDWPHGYPHVWLGVTIEDQGVLPERTLWLKSIPATVRFLSMEPLLEAMPYLNLDFVQWVIVGGESGPNARPMNPAWAEDIRLQCEDAGVPFFFKQMGGTRKIGGTWGGDELYGHTYKEFPKVIQHG